MQQPLAERGSHSKQTTPPSFPLIPARLPIAACPMSRSPPPPEVACGGCGGGRWGSGRRGGLRVYTPPRPASCPASPPKRACRGSVAGLGGRRRPPATATPRQSHPSPEPPSRAREVPSPPPCARPPTPRAHPTRIRGRAAVRMCILSRGRAGECGRAANAPPTAGGGTRTPLPPTPWCGRKPPLPPAPPDAKASDSGSGAQAARLRHGCASPRQRERGDRWGACRSAARQVWAVVVSRRWWLSCVCSVKVFVIYYIYLLAHIWTSMETITGNFLNDRTSVFSDCFLGEAGDAHSEQPASATRPRSPHPRISLPHPLSASPPTLFALLQGPYIHAMARAVWQPFRLSGVSIGGGGGGANERDLVG